MKPVTRTSYEQLVLQAAATIVASVDVVLDQLALARAAALSPLHFQRIFRGLVGETPLELHRRLRLERAAAQLAHGDAKVTRIAFDAGYETHESFTRAFRDAFALTPSELRTSARAARERGARGPQTILSARCRAHYTGSTDPLVFTLFLESTMNVTIDQLPMLRVAAVSHRGPYHQIAEAFGRLDGLVRPTGLLDKARGMVAIYHDDPETTPPHDLTSNAGVIVPTDATLPVGLTEVTLPAGRYARTTHVGPYDQLGDAWAQLMGQWLPASGHKIGDGHTYEKYLDTPMDTPPDQLRTELYLPLA